VSTLEKTVDGSAEHEAPQPATLMSKSKLALARAHGCERRVVEA